MNEEYIEVWRDCDVCHGRAFVLDLHPCPECGEHHISAAYEMPLPCGASPQAVILRKEDGEFHSCPTCHGQGRTARKVALTRFLPSMLG